MAQYSPYIYDGLIAVVLLIFFLRGRRKGLILTLFSLAGIFVAFFGARAIARAAAPAVSDLLRPRLSAAIERRFEQQNDAAAPADASSGEEGGLSSILKSIGLPERPGADLVDRATEQLNRTVRETSESLSRSAADAVATVIVFCVAFLTLLALWALLGRLLDLAAKLPGLNLLNRALGGLFGLVQGMLILFLIIFALRLFGVEIPQEARDGTVLLRFFCTADPIRLLGL